MTGPDTRLVGIDRLKGEIAERLPISEVAERLCGLELVPAGSQHKAPCPFHDEDTPSFFVNDGKGLYHCFGCDAGGDWIDLVQNLRHVEFYEALYLLAAEAEIDITKFERPLTEEEKRREQLRAQIEGWIASLPLDTSRVDLPQSPMAPRVVSSQPDFLSKLPSWLFRGVLFPMRSASGKLVGWKCRGAEKQMFATSEKELPQISERTLFGIDIARQFIRERGEVILVEGEYDCLQMHAHGFENTVAVGGTAFTDDQMAILQSLRVPKAVIAFDGDEGGHKMSRKISERWWAGDVRVFIASLPEGQDPEDMLLGDGGFLGLAGVLDDAKWALEFALFDEWTARGDGISEKLEYLEWIQGQFGGSLTQVQETVVSQHVATWLGLPEAQVLDFGRGNKSKLQATDSEQIVIGRSLRDKDYYRSVRKKLDRSDFYMVRHQRLWKVLEELLVEDMDFEVVAIKQRAESMGVDAEYVDQLLSTNEGNIGYHEDQVLDLALRRSAQEQADHFRERITDTTLDAKDTIGNLTLGVTRKTLGSGQRIKPISEQVDAAVKTLHERMKNPDGVHGFDLGSQFPLLTRRLQGLQKKRLVLVAATSGVGKTTITLQWAINLAVHQSVPTDFISLEMDEEEMIFKAASHLTGIAAEKITAGALEQWEAVLVEQAMARVRKSPFRIYAPDDISPNEFVLYARESVMEHRTEVFILDYAQLVSPDPGSDNKKTYEQLKEFGRTAKMQIARGMNTCVICPAQLNRNSAEKERPTKEDMGDCYDLSRTADVVMVLKAYEGSNTVELWLDKSRQTSGGHLIPTEADLEFQTFFEHGAEQAPDYRLLSTST